MSIGINLEDDTYFGHPDEKESIIQEVFKVSGVVAPRTRYEVLTWLMQEVGELSTEVSVAEGYAPNSKRGDDGIIGEAVDVIVCALDLIWVDWKNANFDGLEKLVMVILKAKLEKWKEKRSQINK